MSEAYPSQNIRELLQYLPQFSGKTFVIELAWKEYSDSQKSEVMLDIVALQSIGVNMCLAIPSDYAATIVDWAIDFDLRLENDIQMVASAALAVMNRGQIVMIPSVEGSVLDHSLVELIVDLEADKVITLLSGDLGKSIGQGTSLSHDEWLNSDSERWSFYTSVSLLLGQGVSRVHLLDAELPSVILGELFSNEGCGLMIYRDSYRQIRKMRSDDIPEVLVMIGRSVRNSRLVPREYEDIENQLQDYYVYQIDENVIGCAALHTYEEGWAEVACLYIKNGHQGRGYGQELVSYLEDMSQKSDIEELFALTTRSTDFFQGLLGYQEIEIDRIPTSRLEMLRASGRDSLAFVKSINEKKTSL